MSLFSHLLVWILSTGSEEELGDDNDLSSVPVELLDDTAHFTFAFSVRVNLCGIVRLHSVLYRYHRQYNIRAIGRRLEWLSTTSSSRSSSILIFRDLTSKAIRMMSLIGSLVSPSPPVSQPP